MKLKRTTIVPIFGHPVYIGLRLFIKRCDIIELGDADMQVNNFETVVQYTSLQCYR